MYRAGKFPENFRGATENLFLGKGMWEEGEKTLTLIDFSRTHDPWVKVCEPFSPQPLWI